MPVSPNYREGIEDRLGAVVPALKLKSMFGGVGVYSGASFFALLDDDRLYFKVDATNRGDFEAAGLGPFRPFPDKPDYVMQYYEVPASVLDDAAILREWAAKAIAVAASKKKKSSRNKKKA
jgi:DNA transformation protein and related proteins